MPIGIVGQSANGGSALVSGIDCPLDPDLPGSSERLEKGRFVWPPIVDGALHIKPGQLALLFEAIDWRRTVQPALPARPVAV